MRRVPKVLVSAYPMTTNCHIGEFYSDNIDENSRAYSYLFRLNEVVPKHRAEMSVVYKTFLYFIIFIII